ncbi:MAG TPA: hypothetical protein HA355_00425 [Methanosphaera sp.]|nr:hypothetical protein [Methanosphaera sp.]HII08039.1 hypothetical protein [Methanosphaera sp.]
MDAIIKLDDIKVKEWEKAKIEFDVVDEEDNPLNGRVAVKINQETKFDTTIEDGKFSKLVDFSSFHEPEYTLDVIYGGNDQFAPAMKRSKIIIEKAEPIMIPLFDLQNACYRLNKWIETNKRVPGKILINKHEVTIGNLFKLLVTAVNKLNKNDNSDVELTWVDSPSVSSETITESTLLSNEEYIKITDDILSQLEETKKCPSCVEIEGGKIGFMNLVYTFSTLITNSSTENGLLSGIYIKPWKEIIA